MLQLVLGRSGSGKTKYLLDMAADQVHGGGAAVILIVPEQFSFETERAVLRLLGPQQSTCVEVLSFTRLLDSFRRTYGGRGLEPVNEAERALLMSQAVHTVQDQLQVYDKSADSPDFIRELLAFSARCKQSGIHPEQLGQVSGELEGGLLQDKSRELSMILQSYDVLVNESRSEPLDALDRLADALEQRDFFAGKSVLIDAFKSFTAQEYRILRAILKQAASVAVSLCTDRAGEQPACSRFSITSDTLRRLMRLAASCGVPVQAPQILHGSPRFLAPELAALEENLFEPNGAVYDGPADGVTVYRAMDRAGECDYTAREIKRLLREEHYRCREIAVIMRNESDYMRPLMGALERYGVPVFEDRRSSIASQPLMVLVRCALKMACSGPDTDTLMRYAKSGICGIPGDQIADLENYALMWNIRSAEWRQPFTKHPRGLETAFTPEDEQALQSVEQARRALIDPLIVFFARVRQEATGQELAAALYALLESIRASENLLELARKFEARGETELALEQERVWELLMEILGAFGGVYGAQMLTVRKFFALFEVAVSLQTLGNIPQGLDNITIGTADRARLNAPRAVFLLGVNEGVFPAPAAEGGLFTDREYRTLEQHGIELGGICEERALEERFITYCAASAPSERLYLTYAQADEKGEGLSPSILADECLHILPHCVKKEQGLERDLERIESGKSALSLYAARMFGETGVKRELESYLNSRPEYSGVAAAIRSNARQTPAQIHDPAVAGKLFGRNMTLSASQIETYYQCPFQYYCKYGLKARPRTRAQLDALRSGTAIHYVLEHIIRERGAGGLASCTPEERLRLVEKYLYHYREAYMGGEEAMTARDRYAFSALVRTVFTLIERIAAEFGVCDFEPVDFELDIGDGGTIAPYKLTLEGGGELRVMGKVDRVDLCRKDGETMIRVVDYKSGAKEFRLCDVMQGLNIQMVLYLMCLVKNGGSHYGDALVPAGVLYLSSKGPDKNLGRHATEREIVKKQDSAYRMSGMVLDDARVILAMEKDGAEKYIPAYVDPNGQPGGNVISPQQFQNLNRQIDGLLRQMAEQLHAGAIPAYPVYGKAHDKTCEYCDYQDICRDSGQQKRVLREFKHDRCLAELQQEGGTDNA